MHGTILSFIAPEINSVQHSTTAYLTAMIDAAPLTR